MEQKNKIVENLDKPIMAFAGMIAGKTLNKLLDKFLSSSNMNSNIAEIIKATIITGSSLLGYQHSVEQNSDNAQFFFIGMASSGVAKAVEVISGGQLDGLIDGVLNGHLGYNDDIREIYPDIEESLDEYNETDELDELKLPVLTEDVVIENSQESKEDVSAPNSLNDVEEVEYEDVLVEIYEID